MAEEFATEDLDELEALVKRLLHLVEDQHVQRMASFDRIDRTLARIEASMAPLEKKFDLLFHHDTDSEKNSSIAAAADFCDVTNPYAIETINHVVEPTEQAYSVEDQLLKLPSTTIVQQPNDARRSHLENQIHGSVPMGLANDGFPVLLQGAMPLTNQHLPVLLSTQIERQIRTKRSNNYAQFKLQLVHALTYQPGIPIDGFVPMVLTINELLNFNGVVVPFHSVMPLVLFYIGDAVSICQCYTVKGLLLYAIKGSQSYSNEKESMLQLFPWDPGPYLLSHNIVDKLSTRQLFDDLIKPVANYIFVRSYMRRNDSFFQPMFPLDPGPFIQLCDNKLDKEPTHQLFYEFPRQVTVPEPLNWIAYTLVSPIIQSLVLDSTDARTLYMGFGCLPIVGNIGSKLGGHFSILIALILVIISGWKNSIHIAGPRSITVGTFFYVFAMGYQLLKVNMILLVPFTIAIIANFTVTVVSQHFMGIFPDLAMINCLSIGVAVEELLALAYACFGLDAELLCVSLSEVYMQILWVTHGWTCTCSSYMTQVSIKANLSLSIAQYSMFGSLMLADTILEDITGQLAYFIAPKMPIDNLTFKDKMTLCVRVIAIGGKTSFMVIDSITYKCLTGQATAIYEPFFHVVIKRFLVSYKLVWMDLYILEMPSLQDPCMDSLHDKYGYNCLLVVHIGAIHFSIIARFLSFVVTDSNGVNIENLVPLRSVIGIYDDIGAQIRYFSVFDNWGSVVLKCYWALYKTNPYHFGS